MEKIINKKKVQSRDKYLVRWKGCMAEEDTWESRENLKNVMELVKDFEKEYCREEKEEVRQQENEENRKTFNREIPESCSINRVTRNTIGSIGSKWKKIGDGGKEIHSLDIVGIHSYKSWKKKRKSTREER